MLLKMETWAIPMATMFGNQETAQEKSLKEVVSFIPSGKNNPTANGNMYGIKLPPILL